MKRDPVYLILQVLCLVIGAGLLGNKFGGDIGVAVFLLGLWVDS